MTIKKTYTVLPDKISVKDIFNSELETIVIMTGDNREEIVNILAERFIKWLVKKYYLPGHLGSGLSIVKKFNIRPAILKIIKELGDFTIAERQKIIDSIIDIIKTSQYVIENGRIKEQVRLDYGASPDRADNS